MSSLRSSLGNTEVLEFLMPDAGSEVLFFTLEDTFHVFFSIRELSVEMSILQPKFTTVSEDTVHVNYFSIDSKVCPKTETLEELCNKINTFIETLSSNYIWHKDEFKVYLPLTGPEQDISCLKSTTCFGDNIEDEWFIVHIIFNISMMFEDLIIQLSDNDGDFLLIEAANHLPTWANPESTENRVFIYKGKIHIIPPTLVDLNTSLTTKQAINFIVQFSENTKVSKSIEEAVMTRISKYPNKIYENFHHCVVKVPLDLAALLMLKPALISVIVDSYCNHDIFDVKCCQNTEYKDLICVKVKFTKFLYAMLQHSKSIKIKNHTVSADTDRKTILGVKLMCGLTMLLNRPKKDIFSTKEFSRFLNNLSENGYFRGNIKDSKDYNQLLEKAKQYFIDFECPINTYLSKHISEIMATNEFQSTKDLLKSRNVTEDDLIDDNDDWLNIDPNELNELLNTHSENKIQFKKDDSLTPQGITNKLSDFLKQTSDYEGIDARETKELDTENIEFDSNDFVNHLEKMLNIVSANNYNQSSDSRTDSDNTDDDETIEDLALQAKIKPSNVKDSKGIMFNMTQSIKEEGLSGPTSNLLKTIGINKSDLILDSDDE